MAVSAYLHQRDGIIGDAREIQSRDLWIVTTDPPGNGDDSNPTGIAARAAGLPGLLTAGIRPEAPSLLADRYGSCRAIDGQIGTQWEVEVLYSSTGRFRFDPTQDRTNVGYKTIQDSSARMVLEVPYFSVAKATAAGEVAGQTVQRWKFNRGTTRVDVPLANPQIRVNVNAFTFEHREKIKAQLNKIHSLNSNDTGTDIRNIASPAKFVSYSAEQHADGLWTIVYSWIQDPGNKKLPIGISYVDPITRSIRLQVDYADGQEFNQSNVLGIETLVCGADRAPFYSYVVIPSQGTKKPNIKAIPQYAPEDVTGYAGAAGLPGRPV